MTDENILTEDQIDKFFESGGEDMPDGYEGSDEVTQESLPEDQAANNEKNSSDDAQPLKSDRTAEDESILQQRDNYKKAMDAERIQRKELQQEIQRLKHIEEQFNIKLSKESESEKIDFEEQPLEALKQQNEELSRKQAEMDARMMEQEERERVKKDFDSFSIEVNSKTQEFSKSSPDYKDAYNHLIESRVNELKIQGVAEDKIRDIIAHDEITLAYRAMNEGVNPAEIVYNLAKHRGYVSKQKGEINSVSEKLDRIEKGTSMSKSLGSTGNNISSDFTMESIKEMSQAELSNFVSNDAAWEKLMKMN